MKECECPPEHTITKLGHCRTCPYHRCTVSLPPSHLMSSTLTIHTCGPEKPDHTHDFNWATYADETQSYGVCLCGMDSLSHAIWTLP